MRTSTSVAMALIPLGGILAVTPCVSAATSIAGMGHYCSGTWSNGGWAFTSLTGGGDPCQTIGGSGGTVQRRGLYASNGVNRVVYRCFPPGFGFVGIYEGLGNAPLSAAFNAALVDKKPGCIFNVAPTAMALFDSPFPLSAPYTHASGVDFARGRTLDVHDFGQPGSSKATIVDWKGRDVSNMGFLDDHAGHDWLMPRGTPIRAVASGVVTMARDFSSGCTGSDSPLQKEAAITHTVIGTSASYYEKFLTYYAHLSSYTVQPGQVVNKGDVIGFSGNTGCSTAPHLHFGVIRLTNTSDKLEEVVHFFDTSQHSDATDKLIEPYGWAAPKGFDPWSWMYYPQGALSVYLWRPGQDPGTGNW